MGLALLSIIFYELVTLDILKRLFIVYKKPVEIVFSNTKYFTITKTFNLAIPELSFSKHLFLTEVLVFA